MLYTHLVETIPARQTGLPLLTEEITVVERFDLPTFTAGVKGTAGLGTWAGLVPQPLPLPRIMLPHQQKLGGKHPVPTKPGTLSPRPGEEGQHRG